LAFDRTFDVQWFTGFAVPVFVASGDDWLASDDSKTVQLHRRQVR
jgi:hypothetical protein